MLAWEGLIDLFDLRALIRSPEGKAEMSTELEIQQALLSSELHAFVKLSGTPRHLAEMIIAMRLENADPRVPEALARLDAAWTVPALEEVAQSPALPAELRAELLRAARALEVS
jgi:hypothetical protein